MSSINSATHPVPRLPVLGWKAISLRRHPPPLHAITAGRDAVFVSSGRAAILLAMELLGVGPGDRVLVPTYHCPTMIAPVTRLGATPVFYPIGESAAPDLSWLASIETAGVKALLAAHFFGLPQAMERVKEYCAARGIALIEDCAHAFFGSSGATPIGAYGDLAIASFPKFFPVVEGGCLVGPADLLDRVALSAPPLSAELRAFADSIEIGASHGRFGIVGRAADAFASVKRSVRGHDGGQGENEPEEVDQQPWLDENQLRRTATASTRWIVRHSELTRIVEQRRANYTQWASLMRDIEGASPLFPQLPDGAAPYVFPLKVSRPEPRYRAVRACGVPVFRWDIAWPGMPRIEGDVGAAWQTEVFQLACHQDLDASEISAMAAHVRSVIEETPG